MDLELEEQEVEREYLKAAKKLKMLRLLKTCQKIQKELRIIFGNEDYAVTAEGDVYSYKRGDWIIRKPFISKNGYHMIILCCPEKKKHFSIARLVLSTFGRLPVEKEETNHKDGNKSNNHLSNLEWVSAKENVQHAFRTGLRDNTFGEKHARAAMSKIQVKAVRILSNVHKVSDRFLSNFFKVSRSCIYKIRTRQSWKHI